MVFSPALDGDDFRGGHFGGVWVLLKGTKGETLKREEVKVRSSRRAALFLRVSVLWC